MEIRPRTAESGTLVWCPISSKRMRTTAAARLRRTSSLDSMIADGTSALSVILGFPELNCVLQRRNFICERSDRIKNEELADSAS
jgi:hypothetical protein